MSIYMSNESTSIEDTIFSQIILNNIHMFHTHAFKTLFSAKLLNSGKPKLMLNVKAPRGMIKNAPTNRLICRGTFISIEHQESTTQSDLLTL